MKHRHKIGDSATMSGHRVIVIDVLDPIFPTEPTCVAVRYESGPKIGKCRTVLASSVKRIPADF